MPIFLDAEEFRLLRVRTPAIPLLDVRSPQEFARGHIPGACNLPLFSDAERNAVGTAYAQQSPEEARLTALRLVGPALADKLLQARKITTHTDKSVCMHCWRGGMRSAAMAWLLEQDGFTVHLLRGGYKAYRAAVRADWQRPARLILLTGMTGCGKTELLTAMRHMGAQTLDLEALAQHRGSVFGNVGLPPQPSSEQYENDLHEQWMTMESTRPIWLEDESKRIGSIVICDALFARMEQNYRVVVDSPRATRIKRLAALYSAGHHDDELCHAIDVLRKRLGGDLHTRCLQAVRAHDYSNAADLLLGYYDKVYKRSAQDARVLGCIFHAGDTTATARQILTFEKALH